MVLITCKNSGQMFVTGINWHSGKTGLAGATGRKEFGIAKWKSHRDACAAGVFSLFFFLVLLSTFLVYGHS